LQSDAGRAIRNSNRQTVVTTEIEVLTSPEEFAGIRDEWNALIIDLL
jgi:hypothetical protein